MKSKLFLAVLLLATVTTIGASQDKPPTDDNSLDRTSQPKAEQQSVSSVTEALKLITSGGFGGLLVLLVKYFADKKLQVQKHEQQKQVIEYTSLHDKQAQIIADFYAQLSDVYTSLDRLILKLSLREMKEELAEEIHVIKKQIDLSSDEKEAIDLARKSSRDLYDFYRKKKIYLSLVVCELTDRFCTLASFLAGSYEDVAVKDEDGNLYVSPEVRDVWLKAIEAIPELLVQLEKEFRDMLGVMS